MRSLRICFVASSRFPIAEPFAGGLEAHTHALVSALIRRGHDVTLYAAPGSDPALGAELLDVAPFSASTAARRDVSAPPAAWMREHHAYLSLMLGLRDTGRRAFDVVHNNCLHHLPIAMAPALGVPMVTTLHTPPTPWLESALELGAHATTVVAVSRATARQWAATVRARVIHNGVDMNVWRQGEGGAGAVWFGRLVPEKGAHLAIDAARRAGVPLTLAGPCHDDAYFADEIERRLRGDVRYVGHLSGEALHRLVGGAAVALVTPRWDEPYGLVAAEAMACGTPVAAFDRGALGEIVTAQSGRLCTPDDVGGLAASLREAARLPRDAVRRHAERSLSIEAMVDAYEGVYAELVGERVAA